MLKAFASQKVNNSCCGPPRARVWTLSHSEGEEEDLGGYSGISNASAHPFNTIVYYTYPGSGKESGPACSRQGIQSWAHRRCLLRQGERHWKSLAVLVVLGGY